MRKSMENVLAAHKPTRWRSFTNENEILRCCGQDFGTATRKPSRDDADKTWAAWSAHVAEALALAGFGSQHDAWAEGAVTALNHAIENEDGMTLRLEHLDGRPWTNPYPKVSDS